LQVLGFIGSEEVKLTLSSRLGVAVRGRGRHDVMVSGGLICERRLAAPGENSSGRQEVGGQSGTCFTETITG
jgi:hypothetical protein